METDEQKLAKVVEQAVINALGRGAAEDKYIDIGRIPFICDDIRTIRETLEKMQEGLSSFPIVKTLVFSTVGLLLTGLVTFLGIIILHYLHLN